MNIMTLKFFPSSEKNFKKTINLSIKTFHQPDFMRILILTAIPFWHPGTQELIDRLRANNIEVEALDIFHGKKLDANDQIIDLVRFKGVLRKIYLKLFRTSFTKKHTRNFDAIDIHFIEPHYSKYVLDLPQNIACSIFGSDLYRTTESQKKLQAPLFDKATSIVLSENMTPYFNKYFPGHPDKFVFNQYGSNRLDFINDAKGVTLTGTFSFPVDKKIVTCGYNGKREQQHLIIIEKLSTLSDLEKDKIHLVFPLTYGLEPGYVDEIENSLIHAKISYSLIENRLSDEELVELRLRSDISINTQTTDALASSVKESFVANDIMLIGDWLPYSIYQDMGIYYEEISFETLVPTLLSILTNFDELRVKCSANAQIIMEFASWNVLIKDWIKFYENLNNEKQ